MKYRKLATALFYGNAICAAINAGTFAATLAPANGVVMLLNIYAAWDLNKQLKQSETKNEQD